MKGFDAIQPEYNCFISMIISVDTLCGFAPLGLAGVRVVKVEKVTDLHPPMNSHLLMTILTQSSQCAVCRNEICSKKKYYDSLDYVR